MIKPNVGFYYENRMANAFQENGKNGKRDVWHLRPDEIHFHQQSNRHHRYSRTTFTTDSQRFRAPRLCSYTFKPLSFRDVLVGKNYKRLPEHFVKYLQTLLKKRSQMFPINTTVPATNRVTFVSYVLSLFPWKNCKPVQFAQIWRICYRE